MKKKPSRKPEQKLFESHQREFQDNRYVYPVLSRRSGGISIGVNLSLDKTCNFDCIYCQVDRNRPGSREPIDIERLAGELDQVVELVVSGRIYEGPKFGKTPESLRRLNDIAFSGNGEPTNCPRFDRVVAACIEVRRRRGLDDVKLVLITNASMLHRNLIRRALRRMDNSGGEIWAKLDAGTEEYHEQVSRSAVPFQRILDNITETARARPIVIQSLFMRIDRRATPPEELAEYCQRLREIVDGGGQIKLVQVHTVARTPAESNVTALSKTQVDAMAKLIGKETGLPVERFYG